MTPSRLRQIAEQLERSCSDYRKITKGESTPCNLCKAAAEELCELAKSMPIPNSKAAAA